MGVSVLAHTGVKNDGKRMRVVKTNKVYWKNIRGGYCKTDQNQVTIIYLVTHNRILISCLASG